MAETVQDKVNKLMEQRGWSQGRLARELGVSSTAVGNWRSGKDALPIYEGMIDKMLTGVAPEQPIPTAIMTGAGEINPPPPGSHLDNLLQIQAGLAMAMRENQRQIEAEIVRLRTVRQGASGDPGQDQ